MILEMIYKQYGKEKVFLSLVINQQPEIGFLANQESIKISCNSFECEIKTNKSFDSLVNVVHKIRNRIDSALKNKNKSLVIDLAKYL